MNDDYLVEKLHEWVDLRKQKKHELLRAVHINTKYKRIRYMYLSEESIKIDLKSYFNLNEMEMLLVIDSDYRKRKIHVLEVELYYINKNIKTIKEQLKNKKEHERSSKK
jgi:hypothetical protein